MPISDQLGAMGEIVALIGHRRMAAALIPLLEPYAGQLAVGYCAILIGLPIDSCLGQLRALDEQFDAAVTDCASGLALAEQMDAPLLAAQASISLADVLLRRDDTGDAARARALAGTAASTAEACGASVIAGMATRLLDG